MSRKDYELIAAALGQALVNAKTPEEEGGVVRAASRICLALADDNERFDARRFAMAVAGGTGDPRFRRRVELVVMTGGASHA